MSNKNRNIFLIFSVFLVLIVATGCAFASDSDTSADDSASVIVDSPTTADVSQAASDTSSSDESLSSSSQSSSVDTSSATDTSSSSSSPTSTSTSKDTSSSSSSVSTKDTISTSSTSKDVNSTTTTTKDTTSSSTSSQATQTVKDTDNSDKAQQITTEKTLKSDGEGTFSELDSEIQNAQGTLTLDKNYVRGESEDIITISNDITIDGAGYTIDANQLNGTFIIPEGTTVVLENMILTNAYTSVYEDYYASIIVGGNVTINNLTFTNNNFRYSSVINTTTTGNLSIYDSYFYDNYAQQGMIRTHGPYALVENCVFENNTSANGCIYTFTGTEDVVVNNSKFLNNYASNYGAGIQVYRGSTYVYNTEFINNTSETKGGAVYIVGTGSHTYENCVFINNTVNGTASNMANIQGGAIAVRSNTVVTFKNNTMSGNSAYNGSDIYLDSNAKITPVFITVDDSQADEGEVATITAHVADEMGNTVTGGTITFTVNGKTYSSYVQEGVAEYNITDNLAEGSYEITAEYSYVNENVEATYTTGTLTVGGETPSGPTGSFTELAALIDSTEGTLTLTENYARGEDEANITISKDITIDGAGYTISANQQNSAFFIMEGANVVFENVVLADGYTASYNDEEVFMHVAGGLTLNNVTIKDHHFSGSSVINVTQTGSLVINDSTICDSYGQMGVVQINTPSALINNTEFRNCSSANGAIRVSNSAAVLTVDNSKFIANNASNYGGAIQVRYGSTVINNTEFTSNVAGTKGGAIYITSTGSQTIENCVFTDNIVEGTGSSHQGGAIAIATNVVVTFKNNTMSGNSAYNGSDIYLDSNAKITPVFITVDDSQADEGEVATITAHVADEMGNTVTGGTITFTVNGKTYSSYVQEGVAEYNITDNLAEGSYEITAEYSYVSDDVTATYTTGTLTIGEGLFNYAKLQALIDEADAGSTITITDDIRRGSSETNVTVNKDITIDLSGFAIDTNNGSVFVVEDGATLTIENTAVNNIYAQYGGFAYVDTGKLVLNNVTIENATTTGLGYAAYDSIIYISSGSSLDMNDTVIRNISGAVLNLVGSASINNSMISNVNASAAANGVIILTGQLTLNNSFIGNTTSPWSAIYGQKQNLPLTIDNTLFYNNTARSGSGAAILNSASTTITNSVFIANTQTNSWSYGGGVIYVRNDLSIDKCIFINNTAAEKGSIIYNGFGNVKITNSALIPTGEMTAVYTDTGASTTLDYNWWGTNSDPSEYANTAINNWIVMTTTLDPEQPEYKSNVTITTTFDKYTDSTGTLYDYTDSLPDGLQVTYTSTSELDVLENTVTTVVDGRTTNTLEVFEDTTLEVTQAAQTNTFNIEIIMPEPTIYIVYEYNFYDFFNEDGTVNKDAVIPYSELQFAGTITNKNITLDQPLNLTSYSEDPVDFKNLKIDVVDGAQGSNITNLVIDSTDYSEYVIGIIDTADITVESNTITMTNQEGKTRAIYINGSVNNKVLGNTITTYGPSDDIDYAMMTGFANTMSIMVYNSSYNVIDNNVITTGYTTTSGRYGTCTIVGVGIYGDYTFDWSTFQSGYLNASYNNITNNVITTTGYNYTYGIDLLYGAYYSVVENNIITTTSNLYSAGIQVSGPGSYMNITRNTIDLKADNITYGIILQSVYGSTSNNIVTYNTITTDSSTTYLIELYASSNNNVSYNDLKSENANAAMGIGLSGSSNNYIEYNNIDVSGTNDKTPYPGDYIQAKNTGIGIYSSSNSNTITNNNVESTVGTGDCYAVDLNTTTSNTVTDNYLISTGYEGDDSVFSTSSTNTIKDNAPNVSIKVDGRTVTVTVDVGEENDGYIIVKVNGKTLKDEDGKTVMSYVEDGVATYTFDLNASSVDKDYEVSYVYSGSAGVLRGSKNVTISPEIATVVVDAIDNAKAGQTVTLTAHITDSKGEAVTSGKVVFKLNGKTLKDANGNTIYGYVDENGIASINYTLPDNYSAKDYVLTAVFQGSGYERAEANSTLTIVKTTPTILPDSSVFGDDNKITITQGTESVQIKATINDPETNTPINSTTIVTIKINNKTVTQQYVNDGQIDITIYTSSFKNPEYTITVVVGENSQYARTTLDATLEVVTPTSLATIDSYNGTLLVTPDGLETGSSYNGTIEAKD